MVDENGNTLQVLVSAEGCVGDSVFSSEGCRRRRVRRRNRRPCCRCQICFHVHLHGFFSNRSVRSYSQPFYSHLLVHLYSFAAFVSFLQTKKGEKNKKTQYNIVPSILFFFFASFKVTRSLTSARDSPGELNMDLAKVGVVVTRRG